MAYNEDEYLQLSGIQHFRFCRRQWALIHIENLWAENVRTVDGELMHERAHDSGLREKRAGVIVTRDLAISSPTLGASGACDVVEFRKSADGIPLPGEEGRFRPYPVEYKHVSPWEDLANELQLCGQAMCLEEMLLCAIPEGSLYYGETRRRGCGRRATPATRSMRCRGWSSNSLKRRRACAATTSFSTYLREK